MLAQAGALELELAPIAVGSVLKRTLNAFQPVMAHRRIRVRRARALRVARSCKHELESGRCLRRCPECKSGRMTPVSLATLTDWARWYPT